MKKFLLSIFALMLAVFSVQAEEYSYTFTSKQFSANGNMTLNEVNWTLAGDGGYWGSDGTKGQQFGSSKLPYKTLTLSTSDIKGTITKIVINTSGASSVNASFTVHVGETQYGSSTSLTTTATDYTFEGSASGEIKFSYTQTSSKALYIKSIAVTYTTGTGEGGSENPEPEEPETPVVTPPAVPTLTPSCYFDNAMIVEITDIAEGATAYYSLNNDTEWTAGTSVTISETTTVYAKVVKDELSSEVVFATYTKNEPVDPNVKEVETTISFASTAQRLSQDGNSQVWNNGDITFTNNKSASSNAVVGNTNPVRLYANSELVIECTSGNIKKIVFDCNSTSYATTLKNSIGDAATASSDKVTVTLDGTSNNFTVAKLTAQVRMDALTVTYLVSASQEEKPAAPTFSVETGSKFYPTLELEISAAEGAVIYYTLNGENPTTVSDVYSTPITIEETTVVKAIAVVDGVESAVAAANYKKVVESVTGNVADAFNYYVGGEQIPAVITGYIVGAVNGTSFGDGGENCKFDVTEIENDANILIADNADETDYTKCLVVQLPSGEIRTALNLVNNPGNLKKKVVLTATLETYFGIAGLKSTSAYEFIPEYNLSVTAAGWATLFLDFNATIPADVKAYTVTAVNNGYVTLTQVTGVLPANTGIIVNAEEGNYTFNYATEATANVDGNKLKGSATATEIEEDAYVLSIVNGEVGLYKATTANMARGFLNNANRAYLPASAVPASAALSAGFRFDFDGTTAIEEVETEAAETVIYDLTGRRVNEITKAGVYIINGHKILVK